MSVPYMQWRARAPRIRTLRKLYAISSMRCRPSGISEYPYTGKALDLALCILRYYTVVEIRMCTHILHVDMHIIDHANEGARARAYHINPRLGVPRLEQEEEERKTRSSTFRPCAPLSR